MPALALGPPRAAAAGARALAELLGEGDGRCVCAGGSVVSALWSVRAHLASHTDAK
jgi:hypothetical protein